MANFTMADIKTLRERTGAGMMDVKKALEEAEGNIDKAVELIRIKGLKGVTKREGRTTSEGLVASKVDGNVGVMIEILCETDFVAKSDKFIEFGNSVLEAAAATGAQDAAELLGQEHDGTKVSDLLTETGAMLGEKIEIRRVARIEGQHVATYLHRTAKDLPPQVGVLFSVDQDGEQAAQAAHDVALHIAASAPKFVSRDEVASDIVEKERSIAEETARNEGKPEAAMAKIVEGRLNGFFKEIALLDQPFTKDPKKTIAKVLEEAGAQATAFARFRVGEALESATSEESEKVEA